MNEQTIESCVASSATQLYVASSWTESGQKYVQICKWDNGTWSVVPYSGVTDTLQNQARVTALALDGSELYIGGLFTVIHTNAAQNIARLNVSTGARVGQADGLTLNTTPAVMRVASWGAGSTSRKYLYVGGPGAFSLNGTSCNSIGRAYKSSSSWVTESMQGGVNGPSSPVSSSRGVYGLDVNSVYNWNPSSGYTHLVIVSGEFTRAGTPVAVATTNVAVWNEAYTATGPWFPAATDGRGLSHQGYDPLCVQYTDWTRPRASVWSQAAVFNNSAYNVYFTGNFNRVNTTLCAKDMPCGYYAPIDIATYASATYTSSGGLGTLNGSAIYDYPGDKAPPQGATRIAACSSGVYIAGGLGTIIDSTCTFPSSGTVAAGWRLNGTTWTAIGGTSSAGNIAPVYFQDVVTGGNAAFFITIDGYSGVSKYTP